MNPSDHAMCMCFPMWKSFKFPISPSTSFFFMSALELRDSIEYFCIQNSPFVNFDSGDCVKQ